nr:methyltransferase [Niveispirillum sp. SYP-B3756]
MLGGRVKLYLPEKGYRAAIDPVLLAAAVPAEPGQQVLDLGCGAGAALLCLAARCADVALTGLDIQADAVRWAGAGIAAGGWADRARVVPGDVADIAASGLAPNSFDHVMTNPPFWELGRHSASPVAGKAASHGEGAGDLTGFIQAALRLLKSGGSLTVIFPAVRLASLLALMEGRFGDIAVLPLWPRAGVAAKRVIVQGRRDRKSPLRLLPGLVLHGPGQTYTPETEAILRDAAPLPLS